MGFVLYMGEILVRFGWALGDILVRSGLRFGWDLGEI